MTDEKATPGRRRGRYLKEFRRDATALVIDQHRTVADVARELGVVEHTLGNWVRQERIDRGEREGTTTEMREENATPAGGEAPDHGARPVQTKCGLLGEGAGPVNRYRFVSAMKAESFPVDVACEVAEVSTSAYYEWVAKTAASPTDAEWDEALGINEMRKVHDHLDDSYGSPRMTTEPASRGLCTNHKRVERLMAENGIYAKDGQRKKVRTTIPDVTARR